MSGLNKDELTKLIYDNELFHGTVGIGIVMDMRHIEKFANLVAAAEREACAKICEAEAEGLVGMAYEGIALGCAEVIRSRGQE